MRIEKFQILSLISAGRVGKRWNDVGGYRSVALFVVALFVVTWFVVISFAVEGPEDDSIVGFEVLCDVEQDFENRHMLIFANLTMQSIKF
jgi:hypothetical protein